MGAALLTLPMLFTSTVMAQELKKPTLEDLIPGGATYRYAENKWYQWYGDFAYLELGIDKVEGTWMNGKHFSVISLEEVNSLLGKEQLGKISSLYSAVFLNS